MAATLGVSAASVSRHWRANGLKPHVVRGFTLDRATGGTPKPTTLLAMATGNHLVIS